jgi:hypothetical protein
MPAFLWKSVEHAPGFLHRWAPWWPWSRFILEWSRDALLALAALPILAVALVINGAFRWVSLLRTGVIYLALIALEHYPLVYLLDLVPWLGRPVAGNPQVMVLIPTAFQMLLSFSTFLFSAWLGCRSPRHADELAERAKS